MIVKICGIKTLDDALAAVDAGADMLGFNFYLPSPRYVEPGTCARIIRGLRGTAGRLPALIGVFVNMPIPQVNAILDACELDFAQLHGDESPLALVQLRGRSFKAIRPNAIDAVAHHVFVYLPCTPPANMPTFLLDAAAPGHYGGSGLTADWSVAAGLAQETRLLLAGGLHPANVAEAIAVVRPWGVDVASGVESAPGVKNPAKMNAFVQQARSAAPPRAGAREQGSCHSYSYRPHSSPQLDTRGHNGTIS